MADEIININETAINKAIEEEAILNKTTIESKIKDGIRLFSEDTLARIDILTRNMTAHNVKQVKELADIKKLSDDKFAMLTKKDKFFAFGLSIYLYILAKYNSKSRGLKIASIISGCVYTKADIDSYARQYPVVAEYIERAKDSFKDSLREEIYHRAVEGEEVPVFNKNGEHIDNIVKKDNKLFEAMVKANCEEYKEKNNTVGIAGNNVTFQVVNFLQEE